MHFYAKELSCDELRKLDPDSQLDYLLTWFKLRYEDPVNSCPYESAEGGYQWIWGGPHDARDVLSTFEGCVKDDVLEEAVKELENECTEWSPIPTEGDFDLDLIRDIKSISEYYHTFHGAMLDIDKLLKKDPDPSVERLYYRLLYANLITVLETYLHDAFLNFILHSKKHLRSFIENAKEFKEKKVPLSDLYKEVDNAHLNAIKYASDTLWHNLHKAKNVYKHSFGVEFPENLEELSQSISIRHDIVHRNGKNEKGEEVPIYKKDVENLKTRIKSFINEIEDQLPKIEENDKKHQGNC